MAETGTGATKRITVFSDMSERVHYNIPELPIYAHCDPISAFADYRCPCHWHRDLEFVRVVSGTLHYFVNGHTVVMHAGDGLVVNSSRLHYSFSPERREAWLSCAVIGPGLFENLTTATGARCSRAFAQHMDDFLTLSPDVPWQRDALMDIERVVRLMPGGGRRGSQARDAAPAETSPDDPLPAVAAAIRLCDAVLDRFSPAGDGADAPGDDVGQRDRLAVLNMIGVIQQRFGEPLGLNDIAAAGGVSRSQCCILFRRYVGRTPGECLADRRLEEAKGMLAGTDASVAETARACGFSSSSYFISVFRRSFGMTPNAYRNTRA
ncbi:AraC family transcriptional regulator [Bifidobacterium platyrrhinorum]|uniref:Helix-turn-helix domain-containing protein n=1 Tax=Bifidobacterium platyrrhinorum TaxID=2661628 RepID=A0A6L9SRB1_9BIFI|nr:AraC family transcriptional regulator [Bifidobacterium platyrrhinorum]NEG54579.1 helix-turn-helix domain-containing protein [Bifidobacterium platyrrhinorum]